LGLGPLGRVGGAPREMLLGRERRDGQRVLDLLIGPEAAG
jgi:hypothetical protein